MSKSKAPRKAYKPKALRLNTMRAALAIKGCLNDQERQTIMGPTREALEALRTGNLTSDDWRVLTDCANVGAELCKLGICSDGPSVAILMAMLYALGDIARQLNERQRVTARASELNAITEGVERHAIQLRFCSGGELRDAINAHERDKAKARSGKYEVVTIEREGVAA